MGEAYQASFDLESTILIPQEYNKTLLIVIILQTYIAMHIVPSAAITLRLRICLVGLFQVLFGHNIWYAVTQYLLISLGFTECPPTLRDVGINSFFIA